MTGFRARSHRAIANAIAKVMSLRWVLSIPIAPFTLSESESDVANELVHVPFEVTSLSLSPYVNKPLL